MKMFEDLVYEDYQKAYESLKHRYPDGKISIQDEQDSGITNVYSIEVFIVFALIHFPTSVAKAITTNSGLTELFYDQTFVDKVSKHIANASDGILVLEGMHRITEKGLLHYLYKQGPMAVVAKQALIVMGQGNA